MLTSKGRGLVGVSEEVICVIITSIMVMVAWCCIVAMYIRAYIIHIAYKGMPRVLVYRALH